MATYIPAMRAQIGVSEYFVTALTMGEAARLIDYVEDVDGWTSETSSELKIQRKLNTQRVERELVPYLLNTPDHFYSALTVELRLPPRDGEDREVAFEVQSEFPGGVAFGTLTLDGSELLYALDGQHRLRSIELAIRQRPELASEHISLILIPFLGLRRSQTLFSDLNRNAKAPSKSVSLLFSHRDPVARAAKAAAAESALLRDRVNLESTSLSSNSRHFITLSTLYEVARTLAGPDWPGDPTPEDEDALRALLVDVFDELAEAIPSWRLVRDDAEHPAYLRQRELAMHGVGQRAIAEVVQRARELAPRAWQPVARKLGSEIDWRLANPDWQSVAMQGGRVNNTATSIRLLSEALCGQVGLGPEASTPQRPRTRRSTPRTVATRR